MPDGERVRAGAARARRPSGRELALEHRGAGAAARSASRRASVVHARCRARARSGGSRASRAPTARPTAPGSTRSICCASDQSCGLRSITSSSAPSVYVAAPVPVGPVGQSALMPPRSSRPAPGACRGGLDERRRTARRARAGRSSVSACHCTPSTNVAAGASMPSITPSGAQATARRPRPSRSTAWWWKELTRARRRRISRCELAAGRRSRPRASTRSPGALWRWSIACPGRSGRCWWSVPPRATLSACSPRQMARIGRPRASARRASSSSKQVELGLVGPELGVAALVVGGGVEVGPAGQADAREPVEQRLDGLEVAAAASPPAGRRPPRSPAGRSARAPSRAAAARPAGSGSTWSATRTSEVVTPISGPHASTHVSLPPPSCGAVHDQLALRRTRPA